MKLETRSEKMSYDQCKEEVIAVNDLEFTKYHEAR